MTELQMLEGCKLNNISAQEVLYNKYNAKMLGVCYRYASNRADAEDMLQEGFIRIFTQLHQYRNEGSLEGWIRKVIVHTCINILKKNKKFSEYLDITHAENMEARQASVYSMMQTKHIIECIRMLPLGYKTVLNLYAIEGYSHKEIASILEIEEGTSRSQYARAKIMLENILIIFKLFYFIYVRFTSLI
jgi:RNA polymerase sigma-70 factor (ECF subfamily)